MISQGTVVRVEKHGADGVAHINMTDFPKLRIFLPVSEALEFVIIDSTPSKGNSKRVCHDSGQSCRWKQPIAPPSMPVNGPKLEELIDKVDMECHGFAIKPGTRVWVNLGLANGNWPALVWSVKKCRMDDLADILLAYKAGRYLVTYYGEHSLMWVKPQKVSLAVEDEDRSLIESLELWGRKHRQVRLVKITIMEMLTFERESAEAEIKRFQSLYDMCTANEKNACYTCGAPCSPLKCFGCDRRFHTLCLPCPALTVKHLPGVDNWICPCCDNKNLVDKVSIEKGVADNDEDGDNGGEEEQKMGLTPDWIISAAAFEVFGLEVPSTTNPVIRNLLDPCTNSKAAPNIPAEKLYDKKDNGLKLSNVWKGYYVLLNPDFTSQIQWRFVNRAIDEVESDSVPAVILICRNSTDTAFYQRLRPYPRVNLKRLSVLFKDYNHTPIGFGISIFCMASKNRRKELYPKFFSAFGSHGEPVIPVDETFVQTSEFWDLIDRLGDFTGNHDRDHWVKCSECAKWRIVDLKTSKGLENSNTAWTCSMLDPPHSSCSTPLTKMEYVGGHYVVRDDEDEYDPEFKMFDFGTEQEGQEQAQVDRKRVAERLQGVVEDLKRMRCIQKKRSIQSNQNTDLRSLTALELSRKARMAANKAYLSSLGDRSEDLNNASASLEDYALVSSAAKQLASHVAKVTCASEVDKARMNYQQVIHALAKEEAPLKSELEKIQAAKNQAKKNLEEAYNCAIEIEKEFAEAV
jgi:hypothetical protein